jgi:type VI secretion system secreted protein VgrG
LTDYNFKTPNAAMEVDRIGDAAFAEGQIESYDYPGDYLDQGQGKDVAGLRILQERGKDARHRALGDCTSLGAGMTLTLTGDQVHGLKGADYLCLAASHSYVSDAYGSGGADSDGRAYSGEYVLMPVTAPLAPTRKTRVPVVQGPQTAVVVGEGEIDCDEYGRILVHFHWDLNKAYSMRCRVSQNWASKGWGGMVIPRIGMEVVVEFLEGDPDKPLVTGCVYNGKNDPPYTLPEHKTKSVFRSDSHQSEGFNELTFEDATGAEKIYLHGQKDHEIHIENDRSKRIDRNQLESVGRNKTIEVGNNHHEVIGGNMTLMVGPNKLQRFVTQKFEALTSTLGDMASKLGLPDFLNMGEGNMIVGVAKNKAETVMLSSTEVVGAGKATTVGGGFQTIVGGIKNTTVGIGDYEEVGQNKALVVGKQYEIVVGDSKVVMDENGTVSITGKKILIDGEELVRITGKSVKVN